MMKRSRVVLVAVVVSAGFFVNRNVAFDLGAVAEAGLQDIDTTHGIWCVPYSNSVAYDLFNGLGIRNVSTSSQTFACPVTHSKTSVGWSPSSLSVDFISSMPVSCTVACTDNIAGSVVWGPGKTAPGSVNASGMEFTRSNHELGCGTFVIETMLSVFCTLPPNAIILDAVLRY